MKNFWSSGSENEGSRKMAGGSKPNLNIVWVSSCVASGFNNEGCTGIEK